jgi:hypothetical protein
MKMSRELKDIIKDIRETEKLACTKEADVPYKNRPGMGIAIRTACERLPTLIEELKATAIPSRLSAVYATGDAAVIAEAAAFLEKNGGIVINANEIYNKICADIEPTYDRSRSFNTTQHNIMLRGIREIAQALEYDNLPAPPYKETLCKNDLETLAHIRKVIRSSIGDEFSKKYLTKALVNAILKLGVDVPRIPILVLDVQSPEEKVNLNTLFTTNIDYKFPPNFIITSKTLSKIYKNSQNGNSATTGEENKEGE